MTKELSPLIERLLLKERTELVRQRDISAQGFNKQIAEIDAHLQGSSSSLFSIATSEPEIAVRNSSAPASDLSPRELNKMAVESCQWILRQKKFMKAQELHKEMVARAIYLKAEDPERRLVQLLSQHSEIFKSDRVNGWSLKGEASTDSRSAEASSATSSDMDEL